MAKPRNKRKRSVKKVYAPAPAIPQELAGEISFRESALFRGYRPTPFNPDELVGQKGLETYKKMMVDEQVKAAVLAKHYAVLASGYETVPPDSDDAEKQEINEEMTDFVKFNFEEMEGSFDSKLLEILTGTTFGFSVSEKVLHYIDYGRFKGKIGLKAIKTRQPFNIDFDVDEYGNLMDDGILQDQTLRMPKEKFVAYIHRKTFDNFYGEPDLRSAYRSFWLKDNILRFMAITLERYGEPTPIFKHAQRLSALQKAELIDFITKKGAKSGIIIPADITLDFQQPDPRTGTVYIPAIDLCDTHIRIALLMPGLIGMSAEQAVGSLARSQTEFDAFLWVIEQLRKDIETIIDEEVIKQLIDLNYDVTDSKYPSFRFKKITEEIKQGLFKIWSDAVNGNALTKTREDENKARGLIDFPPLPDDVPVKGEPQAPGTTLPDGRIVGADGKLVDTAESLAMRQPPVFPFAHGDRVDFAFCPTGEGGGIDPTCSPGESGKATGNLSESDAQKTQSVLAQKAQDLIEEAGLSNEFSALRKNIAAGQQTRDIYSKDGKYEPDRVKLHDKIIDQVTSSIPASGEPAFVMLGGLPGSGKSSLVERGGYDDHVQIDSDKIKAMLPEYKGWNAALLQREADDIIGGIVSRAAAGNKNILFDATLKSRQKYDKLIDLASSLGYKTGIIFINTPPAKAMSRVIARYKSSGRFVDPLYVASHDSRNINSYYQLKSRVSSYRLYDNDVPRGQAPVLKEQGKNG